MIQPHEKKPLPDAAMLVGCGCLCVLVIGMFIFAGIYRLFLDLGF